MTTTTVERTLVERVADVIGAAVPFGPLATFLYRAADAEARRDAMLLRDLGNEEWHTEYVRCETYRICAVHLIGAEVNLAMSSADWTQVHSEVYAYVRDVASRMDVTTPNR